MDATISLVAPTVDIGYPNNFSLRLACGDHDCTNTCTISGVSPTQDEQGDNFTFVASATSVAIHCPEPIARIEFLGAHYFYYVFASSLTIQASDTPVQIGVALSQNTIYPVKTRLPNSLTVTASISGGSAGQSAGQVISFASVPEEFSGGHAHTGGRPTGTFIPPTCTTDGSGACAVNYHSPEVSGKEKIVAVLVSKPDVQASADLAVMVPGLVNAEEQAGVLNGTQFRFTGYTEAHPVNHFLRPRALSALFDIGAQVYSILHATVGFNDMSLKWGGIFDLGQKGSPYWSKPHGLHRDGLSIDIDHCAKSIARHNRSARGNCPLGWVEVPRGMIKQICQFGNGRLIR
jgi:hypothetical protein